MKKADPIVRALVELLEEDPGAQAVRKKKSGLGSLSLNQEAWILSSAFQASRGTFVVVKPTLFQAQALFGRIHDILGEEAVLFAVEESLQVEAIASSPELEASRMEALYRLSGEKKPHIVVTHLAGLCRYLPDPELFRNRTISLEEGMEIDPAVLMQKLVKSGYTTVDHVDRPLTWAYRGEVLDVFSIQEEKPVRIEFFDDVIDSIRTFDIDTQRTVKTKKKALIAPADDLLFTEEDVREIREKAERKFRADASGKPKEFQEELWESVSSDLDQLAQGTLENGLYRYFPLLEKRYGLLDYAGESRVILSPVQQVESHRQSMAQENAAYVQSLFEERKGLRIAESYRSLNEVLGGKDVYEIQEFMPFRDGIHTEIRPCDFPSLSLSASVEEAARMAADRTVILAADGYQKKELVRALEEKKIPYGTIGGRLPEKAGIFLWEKQMEEGFAYEEKGLVLLTQKELFHIRVRTGRYTDKFSHAQVLNDYDDLAPGDYVVHSQHGIGRYLGIVTRQIAGVHNDYLQIAYRGDDVLLVPLEQFRLVRKFIGSEGVVPRLSKLGSPEWKKTKEKLERDVEEIAEELLQLYTEREQDIGFAFSRDNELQKEFESGFSYPLTKDQETAVREIKEDMEQKKPMDRLLCGDVGFGKTEVAVRAAFKAALDNKQTAFLCPTTILSRQHYQTISARMSGYGIRVAVLNRFVEPSEQKRILKETREGKIDVLIGTHRLLSADVKFHDLGLLVIDEEQRFGVEAKEKIKQMKKSVDVLSLSATPIPRTLQMSLIGVRSLSQLNTPPQDRMPVQTYVVERSTGIIREVIERELARGGQVFYLYNNTLRIYEEAEKVRRLVPQAKVGVAHGRMDRDSIEDVMSRFTDGEYDVLVCTTIIENGIDIPNANTMIVDQADRFGLAQLYQIKGRVGRSNRIAYAYLLYNGKKELNEEAAKRLESIKDFTQLGSGYKIAMRDLAIRGAGDLLGSRQAGFINTVGMDMYVEVLSEAIQKKKGLEPVRSEEVVPRSRIGVDGYIPKEFSSRDYEKIHLYQRIDEASTENSLRKLEEEVVDRYGRMPNEVSLLFEKRRMEILSHNERVQEVREKDAAVEIVFSREWCDRIDGVKLFETVSKISVDLRMRYVRGTIILSIPKTAGWLKTANEALEAVRKVPKRHDA